MDQDQISFYAEFASGYFIRKMFDSCKDLFVNMTIIFYKEGIKCYSLSNDKFQYVDINLNNIPGYQFKAGIGDINQEAKYVVNIKNLVSHIKTVSRGMKLIFKKEAQSSKLILMYGSDNNSCTWFESMVDNNQYFTFPELINNKPVCSIDYKDFKSKLTKPSIIGCKTVQIDSYASHIVIQAIASNNPEGYMAMIGNETSDTLEEKIFMPASMLKHISKQADVCRPGDNIYIFVQPSYAINVGSELPIPGVECPTFVMFQTSIGTYGNTKLYIATQTTG